MDDLSGPLRKRRRSEAIKLIWPSTCANFRRWLTHDQYMGIIWLVVFNIFLSIIYGMSSFPLTFIFFRGVETTNKLCIYLYIYMGIWWNLVLYTKPIYSEFRPKFFWLPKRWSMTHHARPSLQALLLQTTPCARPWWPPNGWPVWPGTTQNMVLIHPHGRFNRHRLILTRWFFWWSGNGEPDL